MSSFSITVLLRIKYSLPNLGQYKGRGDCENRIKELKYDFALEGFNLKEFYATEAALRMVNLAYKYR